MSSMLSKQGSNRKMRYFSYSLIASSLLAICGSVSSAKAQQTPPLGAQSTVTAPSTVQDAPDPTIHLQAPNSGHCGLFETCSTTRQGLGKGDFLVRLSAIGLITNNTHSSVNIRNNPAIAGRQGSITASNQVAPELTFEYFLTDHISLDVIAASTRHEAHAHNTKAVDAFGPAASKLDVGSFWVLPPTLTAAWHFRPHKRFNPYAGIGITVAFFHNTSPGTNLATPAVFDNLKIKPTVGPSFNLGFDYQVVGNWFFNFDIKQILLIDTPIHLNTRNNPVTGGRVHAHDSINPTVIGGGIEYRF